VCVCVCVCVQLLTFHSVLVWSNANFHEPESLGDVLADAADEGVGACVGLFC